MYEKLAKRIDGIAEELKMTRRDFHKHAETGWLEMRTASLVARKLTNLGYEVLIGADVCKDEERMGLPPQDVLDQHYQWALEHGADPEFVQNTRGGFTGVIGILRCGEGPVVAMRFDMDALGVVEAENEQHRPSREEFASMTPGMMHACGHDGHTTIGLGTAAILAEIKDQLTGTVKLIFQPAEEGVRGSHSIVEHGHLDDVDYVMGAHLMGSEDDECYICPGLAGTLATTKLDVVFKGKPAHAGVDPQLGKNAMLAAATAVMNIQAIPRHGGGDSRINVGTLHAGSGRNVVCDNAKMELEVRGETTEVNAYMEAYTLDILRGAAMMHGCTLETKKMGSAAAIECTPAFTEHIKKVCTEKLHMKYQNPGDMGGSEDFAYMTKRVIEKGGQACFTGIRIPCSAPFHNSGFDFDERALTMGVKFYTGMVWDLLGKGEN